MEQGLLPECQRLVDRLDERMQLAKQQGLTSTYLDISYYANVSDKAIACAVSRIQARGNVKVTTRLLNAEEDYGSTEVKLYW